MTDELKTWAEEQAYERAKAEYMEKLNEIRAEIQRLRGCSCSCSDGIIDDVEDILDKYKTESEGEVMDFISNVYDEIAKQCRDNTERTLAEIITKYDFIVGSQECKHRLMEVLPEGASVICSPFIEDPTMIYAVKKFDIMDLCRM